MKYAFIGYYIVITIIGFLVMGVDKAKAKNHKWRISEASLFIAALLGGSLGTTMGMLVFRHKTKHWYFYIGMPLINFIQTLILLYYIL